MPELPEVEIVCRNLNKIIGNNASVHSWLFFRKDLRFVLPQKALRGLIGFKIHNIFRRAKFIIFDLDRYYIVSHLGMTGSWRVEKCGWEKRKHDHLALEYQKDLFLVYEDARRFGYVDVIKKIDFESRFVDYGFEPLDTKLNFDVLSEMFVKLEATIKTALMNQKLLVGVGNIYASEALYKAGINPKRKCSKIKLNVYKRLWGEVIDVLLRAIDKGGSTIENYKNVYGDSGGFQKEFLVYGRKGEPCLNCGSKIKTITQSGRTTFYCPKCQK